MNIGLLLLRLTVGLTLAAHGTQITSAISAESPQRHDVRGRRHEVNDARHHGAMIERLKLGLMEIHYRLWIEDRSARLVDHRR